MHQPAKRDALKSRIAGRHPNPPKKQKKVKEERFGPSALPEDQTRTLFPQGWQSACSNQTSVHGSFHSSSNHDGRVRLFLISIQKTPSTKLALHSLSGHKSVYVPPHDKPRPQTLSMGGRLLRLLRQALPPPHPAAEKARAGPSRRHPGTAPPGRPALR